MVRICRLSIGRDSCAAPNAARAGWGFHRDRRAAVKKALPVSVSVMISCRALVASPFRSGQRVSPNRHYSAFATPEPPFEISSSWWHAACIRPVELDHFFGSVGRSKNAALDACSNDMRWSSVFGDVCLGHLARHSLVGADPTLEWSSPNRGAKPSA
jgi:hypothetical protein